MNERELARWFFDVLRSQRDQQSAFNAIAEQHDRFQAERAYWAYLRRYEVKREPFVD